ncbi:MAG: DUF4281 domain-containing protein [Planctomycetia bacterium]|nr:DUF4281 domain-containing protein [Planctomycetia bacterium]
MKLELLFAVSTLTVLPCWLLMIALPHWGLTRRLLGSPAVLLPIPVLYVVLVVWHWRLLALLVAEPTLPTVALILGEPEGALLGWLHFLALDFVAGRWIYLDSLDRQLPTLTVTPILWATLLLAPLGVLLYVLLRSCVALPEQPDESPMLSPVTPPAASALSARKPGR